MKKTWTVSASVVGGKHIGTYVADTGEEAIQMAQADADVRFCHQCDGECENAECETFTASCGNEVVTDVVPDWESKARAAGWTPPKTKKPRARRTAR